MHPLCFEVNDNLRAGGVVHARGMVLDCWWAHLACRGRVAVSDIESAGDAAVTCLWCLTGKIDETLRWGKIDEGDGT